MERRSKPQLKAFLPDRVIVVLAVEPQYVVPGSGSMSAVARVRRNWPPDQAAHYNRYEPQLLDVLQLGDCFGRCIHRNRRHRRQTISEFAESVGDIHIECVAGRLAHLVVSDRVDTETLSWE